MTPEALAGACKPPRSPIWHGCRHGSVSLAEVSENQPPTALRIGHVPGVTTTKWERIWRERFRVPLTVELVSEADQLAVLHSDTVDMCFVRLPINREGLHAIPLYEEQMVAWTSKEHVFAAVDEVTSADLAEEETVLTELDAIAIDRVLAGAVLVVPMSIARSASRKDLVHRPIVDADPSPIALAWRIDDDNPLLDEFIGVVRGRSANSSRTQAERKASGSKPPTTPRGPRTRERRSGRRR